MATHARGALGRLVHGSVTDDVVRHTTVPVLTVPPKRDED
jgi:nucleotide-binding universal stress UspA family protein